MNMINGDLALTRYVAQNVKHPGVEIWRKLNRQNDPNTHETKETLKRQILRALHSPGTGSSEGLSPGGADVESIIWDWVETDGDLEVEASPQTAKNSK